MSTNAFTVHYFTFCCVEADTFSLFYALSTKFEQSKP
jgi:hypothetical protein